MALKPPKGIDSAEKLHTKALPKTAHAAFKRELSASLTSHLEKTVDLVERLDRPVDKCGSKLKRMKCDAMNGPRGEAEDLMAEDLITEDTASPTRVAVSVGPAHKARHYETTTYGTLAAFASHLDHPEAVELLKKTLVEEEKEMASDQNPTGLAGENPKPEAEPAPGEAAASDESDGDPEPGSGHLSADISAGMALAELFTAFTDVPPALQPVTTPATPPSAPHSSGPAATFTQAAPRPDTPACADTPQTMAVVITGKDGIARKNRGRLRS